MKTCLLCGVEFIGKEKKQKFCSVLCGNTSRQKYPHIKGHTKDQIYTRFNPPEQYDVKKREFLINYLGGKCKTCGYRQNIHALQLDHINSDGADDMRRISGKPHREGRGAIPRYYFKHLEEAKFMLQVLCANCNMIKKHQNNKELNQIDRTPYQLLYGNIN